MTRAGRGAIHHPLAFPGWMISALLTGRKSQDRRLVGTRAVNIAVGHLIWAKEAVVMHKGVFLPVGYQVDGARAEGAQSREIGAEYMPRQGSRLTLAVTGWRMERLRDIRAADAIAEGLRPVVAPDGADLWQADDEACSGDPAEAFLSHWDRHHSGTGGNPTVVVLEFTTKVRNIDHLLAEEAAAVQDARRARPGSGPRPLPSPAALAGLAG